MKDLDYLATAPEALNRIKEGVFLTVKAGGKLNTMTIGWATIGICWRKPIFMVAVRNSRHTFTLIEAAADFTVSMPSGDLRKEIMYCGTKSGREVDKFKACRLETEDARRVYSPIIKVPGRHYECRIVFKSAMDPAHLIAEYQSIYPEKDYHTLYFGEILACYET